MRLAPQTLRQASQSTMTTRASQPRTDPPPLLAAIACLAAAIWSLTGSTDIGIWAFEVLPLGLGILLVAAFRRWLPLTRLTYSMLAVGFIMQCVGGRYTFSAVPLPDGFVEALGTQGDP